MMNFERGILYPMEQSGPDTMLTREALNALFPHAAVERQKIGVIVHGDGQFCPTFGFRYAWPLPQDARGATVNPITFVADAEISRVTELNIDSATTAEILLGTCFEETAARTYFWVARPDQIMSAHFAMVRARFNLRYQGIPRATLLTNRHLITHQFCLVDGSKTAGAVYAIVDWGGIDTAAKAKLTKRYERAVRKLLS